MSMADRIVIMRDGEIMQVGSPEDVYERSANLFVADFIGTPPTNFIDAEIKSDNGNVHLTNPYFDMELSPEAAAPFKTYDKTKLTIGVRPEKVLLTDSASATFSAKCLVSEPQGSHQVIAFELGDKIVKVIAQPTPKIEPGETIHLAFKPENVRFFDPEIHAGHHQRLASKVPRGFNCPIFPLGFSGEQYASPNTLDRRKNRAAA